MYTYLSFSLVVLATHCLMAMESAETLEKPRDAAEWAAALVTTPEQLSCDTVTECFNALTDEYLPLFEAIKNETLEDKIARLDDPRKCRVDEARKLLLKTWANGLLGTDALATEEKKNFDESVTTCINLLGIVISSDDLPINITHRALVTTEENLRKAYTLLHQITSQEEKLIEEEMWWSAEHNQMSDTFDSLPKPKSTQTESLLVSQDSMQSKDDAVILKKQELFEQARKALEEGLALDRPLGNDVESSPTQAADGRSASIHDLALLILQRALLTTVPHNNTTGTEDDYKVRVAARQLASEEAVKGLKIMAKRTSEAIAALNALVPEYEARCAELRLKKRSNVILRVRLKRVAHLTLSQEDEHLLQEFDENNSTSNCVLS